MADFTHHTNCTECGSSDGLAVYSDGGGTCFSCGYTSKQLNTEAKPERTTMPKTKKVKLVPKNKIKYKKITRRKISEETCRKYEYGIADIDFIDPDSGDWMTYDTEVANYRDMDGTLVAQKLKTQEDKMFKFPGGNAELLFGAHLWRNKGGKRIVITEGEMDALAVAEAFECKWPVVSIAAGSKSAKECIAHNLEFLESFDEIILWFDSDKAGIEALNECKGLIPSGKLSAIPFDSEHKDASALLMAKGSQAVKNRTYEAKIIKEDGVISGQDLKFEDIYSALKKGMNYPYKELNEKLMGMREEEITLLTAGTGIGKTTIGTEWLYHLLQENPEEKVGMIYLEENSKKTVQRFIALDNNVNLNTLRLNPALISKKNYRASYDKFFAGGKADRVFIYDHFGAVDGRNLINKIKYMHHAKGCNTILIDHITIAVSMSQDQQEETHKAIETLMTTLRMFTNQTGCHIIAIVHLKRKSGDAKSFGDGGTVSITDLKGSSALEQLADNIIAVERNQQAVTEEDKCQAFVRVLKARESGDTGPAGTIFFNKLKGRYSDASEDFGQMDDYEEGEDVEEE